MHHSQRRACALGRHSRVYFEGSVTFATRILRRGGGHAKHEPEVSRLDIVVPNQRGGFDDTSPAATTSDDQSGGGLPKAAATTRASPTPQGDDTRRATMRY
mmetsp:Transcript_8286/g.34130  ORF Transcript_8286/g.34130 Transcript_8286/m.34130 type:complete len:101 (-) Transcript_8286:900-1202(-)